MRVPDCPAIFGVKCEVDKARNVAPELRRFRAPKLFVSGALMHLGASVFLLPSIPTLDIFKPGRSPALDADGCVLSMIDRKLGHASQFLNFQWNDDYKQLLPKLVGRAGMEA